MSNVLFRRSLMVGMATWLMAATGSWLFAQSESSKIMDDAGMFSPASIREAEQTLKELKSHTRLPVTIQTRKSAGGEPPEKYAVNLAKLNAGEGLYLLILKDDRKIEMLWSGSYKGRISNDDRDRVRTAIADEFKKGDYDAGLKQGLVKISSIAERFPVNEKRTVAAPPVPGPRVNVAQPAPVQRQNNTSSSIFGFLLLGLGFMILIGVLRSLFSGRSMGGGGLPMGRGPGGPGGYGGGGPGYGGGYGGGGGGGFFSGMLGGLGGAILGNWAYDRLGGHGHHDHSGMGHGGEGSWSSTTGGGAYPSADAPTEDAGQWYGADSGGDWGQPREESGGWSGSDSGGWSGGDAGGDGSGGGFGDSGSSGGDW